VNEPLQRTPLFDTHRALSARIVPFAGWEMPVQYAGIVEEHRAVRERAGLFDVSHMGELFLRGPQAEAVVNGLVTNDVGKLPVGKALYTCACNDQGTILDDLIIYRLAAGEVLVVCNAYCAPPVVRASCSAWRAWAWPEGGLASSTCWQPAPGTPQRMASSCSCPTRAARNFGTR
jgi:glycine cleavage system aminomethyltransferase T